jgi:hypothetical protein
MSDLGKTGDGSSAAFCPLQLDSTPAEKRRMGVSGAFFAGGLPKKECQANPVVLLPLLPARSQGAVRKKKYLQGTL